MTDPRPVAQPSRYDGWTPEQIAMVRKKRAQVIVTGQIMNGEAVDPKMLAVADFADDDFPKRPGAVRRWFDRWFAVSV